MEFWNIIVALVQGLLEWLPVSSEGHVILFARIFGGVSAEDALTIAVWLHLGSSAAVVLNFRKTIFNMFTLRDRRLLKHILLATIATAITAVPLYLWLRETITLFQGQMINSLVGLLLILTSILLYITVRRGRILGPLSFSSPVDEQKAISAGLAQGLAVLPGLSRSAVTMCALLLQRVEKVTTLRFSFLMSVPAVMGILVFDILVGNVGAIAIPLLDLILMEIIVFVVSILCMQALIRLAARVEFWHLCLVLGVIALALGLTVTP